VILLAALSGATTIAAAQRLSATFDEPFYLRAGLERWRSGSSFELMRAGTMPLPVDVEVLPVRLWELVRGREWNLDSEFDQALAVARAGNQIFWLVLLWYGFRIARSLAGPWAGRLAAAALAVEPNLVAHAGLATTDLAIAACLFVFCYHYRAGRDGNWRRRVGVPAICYGLAILAKASGLVFVPICVLAIEMERRWRLSQERTTLRRLRDATLGLLARDFLLDCLFMGMLALLVVYIWCGSDWLPHPKIVAAAQNLPSSPMKPPLVWMAEHFAIFNNAGVALCYQIQHNVRGHGTFLLGESVPSAIWYYFPVALSIKLAEPILVGIPLLLVCCRRGFANWTTIASVILLAFSVNCRVQIGVRMQLPLIALLSVGVAVAVSQAIASAPRAGRFIGGIAVTGSLPWLVLSTVIIWPDGLCYVNQFCGGCDQGEQLLSDSNYDWGQGLKELDKWRAGHGESTIDVWYFGTDPAAARPPFRTVPLHNLDIPDEHALAAQLESRYLAVGTTILYGAYIVHPPWLLNRLRETKPMARTRTFLIFDVKELTRSGAAGEIVFRQPADQKRRSAADPRSANNP
jgi:hypothetical protein